MDAQHKTKRVEPSPQAPSEPQTPTTSAVLSDANSTQPTTPLSAVQTVTSRSQSQSRTQTQNSKSAAPLVPVVPIVPQGPNTSRQLPHDDASRSPETPKTTIAATDTAAEAGKETVPQPNDSQEPAKQPSPAPAAPKSWADLVRSKAVSRSAGAIEVASSGPNDLMAHKSETLADALSRLGADVTQYSDRVAFLEPRGLVNTGNMCYMNSVCWPALL